MTVAQEVPASGEWARSLTGRTWLAWVGPGLLGLFVVAGIALVLVRHAAFQTHTLDLGYYTQTLWNTAHGRLFATSLKPQMYLGDHFSPMLALLVPLFWLVPDARTLLVIEVLALVSGAIPAYLLVRRRYPALAAVVVLAFVVNPFVHQSMNHEFHETMLAVPTLALSAYAIATQKDRLLWLGLALTLLVREDMALYVACFGVYLLLFRPGRRWHGAAVIVVSGVWLVALAGLVIPALGSGVYYHTELFSRFGGSIPEILVAIATNPRAVLEPAVASATNGTLLRLLLPVAGLVLLARGEQVLWIPALLLLVLSDAASISRLESWHGVPMIPLLWTSTALVLAQLRPRLASLAAGVLLAGAIAGFVLWSPLPGGGQHEAGAYEITPHAQTGHRILDTIPEDASLATQNHLGAHASTREALYVYPWFHWSAPPQMMLLDAKASEPYPLSASELEANIALLQRQPNVEVVWEEDGYYLFRLGEARTNASDGPWVWGTSLELRDFSLAQSCNSGAFAPVTGSVKGGCVLRVELYWTTVHPLAADYAISARLLSPDGALLARDESRPARGTFSTLEWAAGQTVRDTRYLSVPPVSPPTTLDLSVQIHDTDGLAAVAPAGGHILTTIHVGQ